MIFKKNPNVSPISVIYDYIKYDAMLNIYLADILIDWEISINLYVQPYNKPILVMHF